MKKHIRLPTTNNPIDLTKRTQLNPKQLARVKGGSGYGKASKFDNNGKQSLELIRRLAKARKKAKRFVLFSDQLGRRLFVADPEKAKLNKEQAPLTFNRKEALEFFYGFDNPETKKSFYNGTFKWEVL